MKSVLVSHLNTGIHTRMYRRDSIVQFSAILINFAGLKMKIINIISQIKEIVIVKNMVINLLFMIIDYLVKFIRKIYNLKKS